MDGKNILALMAGLCLLAGCKSEKVHWSHKACVDEIVQCRNLRTYSYTAKELVHDEAVGDDEVHCFDITVKSGDWSERYCCYAVLDEGEVMFVDCDKWGD